MEKKYFGENPNFGLNDLVLEAPPVERMYAIYGNISIKRNNSKNRNRCKFRNADYLFL
jgi:hypothetical protein